MEVVSPPPCPFFEKILSCNFNTATNGSILEDRAVKISLL
jgi:hypothetical protein